MKKIFFIKKLDLLSLFFLILSGNLRNCEIKYYEKTKYADVTIDKLLKYKNIKTKRFINKVFRINNETSFYLKNKKIKLFSKEIKNIISTGTSFTEFISSKINISQSKQIMEFFVGLDTQEILSFVNYCENNNKNNQFKYFICLHLADLNSILKKKFKSNKYNFINVTNTSNLLTGRIIKFFYEIILQIFNNLRSYNKLKNQKNNKEKKIAINYNFELNSPFSNHWWLKKTNIERSNIIYYFSELGKSKATDKVIDQIRSKGYSIKIIDNKLNKTSKIKTEFIYVKFNNLHLLLKKLFLLLYEYKKIHFFRWQLLQWFSLAFKTEYYKSFIENNNINIILDYSETNKDIVAVASIAANIKKIYYQRSDIYFPSYLMSPLHHYFFTWGDLSKDIFSNDNENGNTKFINVGNTFYSFPNINLLKDLALKKVQNKIELPGKTNIAIFDRSSGNYSFVPINEHIKFFDETLKLAELDKNINLLIKPKQKIKDIILSSLNINERMDKLKIKKQLFIFNPSDLFYEAAIISDLTFSLGINSAGIQSAIANATPFFWDPLDLAKSYNELSKIAGYGDGFFVSDKLETIIKNINFYIKNKKDSDLEFSNSYKKLRNHFEDDKASIRIAEQINRILK